MELWEVELQQDIYRMLPDPEPPHDNLLRDKFAGLAMQAMIARHDGNIPSDFYDPGSCHYGAAKKAYLIADAMLEARHATS
jgi:hypothetical protein